MSKKEDALRLEGNKDAMERIWVQIPKELQGKEELVRYIHNDIRYLYDFGFVDTRAFTLEDWEKAFTPHKQPDGTYLFNKQQFLELGRYKFFGHIKAPLDPLKIREGWYDLETWRSFVIRNVIPSTTILTPEFMIEGEKRAKEQGTLVNGRVKIGKEAKLWLKQMLDLHPTPQRRREVAVQESYEKLLKEAAARSSKPLSEASTFNTGKKLGDEKKKNLDEVLVKRSKVTAATSDKETFSLKDLRKSSIKSKKTSL